MKYKYESTILTNSAEQFTKSFIDKKHKIKKFKETKEGNLILKVFAKYYKHNYDDKECKKVQLISFYHDFRISF